VLVLELVLVDFNNKFVILVYFVEAHARLATLAHGLQARVLLHGDGLTRYDHPREVVEAHICLQFILDQSA